MLLKRASNGRFYVKRRAAGCSCQPKGLQYFLRSFLQSDCQFPRHNQDADLDLYSSFVELEWDAYTWAPNFESLGMRLCYHKCNNY